MAKDKRWLVDEIIVEQLQISSVNGVLPIHRVGFTLKIDYTYRQDLQILGDMQTNLTFTPFSPIDTLTCPYLT
jgi:hypothetical protein